MRKINNNYTKILAIQRNLMNFIVNVGWTHKIQITESDILTNRFKYFNICQIIISSLTITGFFGLLAINNYWIKIISGSLSVISLFFTLYSALYQYGKRISKTKYDANNFLKLREKALKILTNICYENIDNINLGKLEDQYKMLEIMRAIYNNNLLNVSNKAVSKASIKIHKRQDNNYKKDYPDFISQDLINIFKKRRMN